MLTREADLGCAVMKLVYIGHLVTLMGMNGCSPASSSGTSNFVDRETVSVKIKELTVQAAVADDDEERMKGLMFVTAEEMAPLPDGKERGMLFVFPRDERNGFWMRNTIIDLDIAFIRVDGTIVQTFTMAALDERSYTPQSMYRYTLEVRAGVFQRFSIRAGDQVDIPESVLKGAK